MIRRVLITGANGGLGLALCGAFRNSGWIVIAADVESSGIDERDEFCRMDLERFSVDSEYREQLLNEVRRLFGGELHCLINNAAVQEIAAVADVEPEAWVRSLNVNLSAPFFLVQGLVAELEYASGSVINVASVHAGLTKPGFVAYSTSKSGLVGLTRALAVELGSKIRVNAISPAAIDTPMLREGFVDSSAGLAGLAQYHPSGSIGTADEVASLALFLAESGSKFLNGAVIGLDGGISGRLHDPV